MMTDKVIQLNYNIKKLLYIEKKSSHFNHVEVTTDLISHSHGESGGRDTLDVYPNGLGGPGPIMSCNWSPWSKAQVVPPFLSI